MTGTYIWKDRKSSKSAPALMLIFVYVLQDHVRWSSQVKTKSNVYTVCQSWIRVSIFHFGYTWMNTYLCVIGSEPVPTNRPGDSCEPRHSTNLFRVPWTLRAPWFSCFEYMCKDPFSPSLCMLCSHRKESIFPNGVCFHLQVQLIVLPPTVFITIILCDRF